MSDKNESLVQAIKFAMIGVLNTLIDFVVFYLIVKLAPVVDKSVAQLIATAVGMTNSYLMNRHFTFKAEGGINALELGKFVVVNIVSSLASIVFIIVFYDLIHIDIIANNLFDTLSIGFKLDAAEGKLLAKVCATPFVLAVNFIGSKLCVFNKK